jgi:RimJ/RimL family protein N-acetyltransferase
MNASSSDASVPAGSETTSDLERCEKLRDGTTVLIRPIQAADEALEREFIERLSPQSRRYRFLGTIKTPSPELLRKFTHPELSRGVAFIALLTDGPEKREIGVCRYSANPDGSSCECAVAVSDEWQGKGLATILMHRLIDTARARGLERMYSIDANDNQGMRDLAEHLGFRRTVDPEDPTLVIHTLDMKAAIT